jgi:hypothetical protein
MEFWAILGQSKFEGLTLFRKVNQERVDTVLVMVAHLIVWQKDMHTALTYIMQRIPHQSLGINGHIQYKLLKC